MNALNGSAAIGSPGLQQALGQPLGLAEREQVPPGQRLWFQAEPLEGDPALELVREEPVVAAAEHGGRHVRPAAEVVRGSEQRVGRIVVARRPAAVRRRRPAGRAGSRSRDRSRRPGPGRRVRRRPAGPPPGRCCPTTRRPSRPVPGSSRSAGTTPTTGDRWQARGALNPPIDWATSTTSSAPAPAATMAWAWSARVAPGQLGRSTANTSCPAWRSRGSTRCQYCALPPAPGTRTNLRVMRAIVSGVAGSIG